MPKLEETDAEPVEKARLGFKINQAGLNRARAKLKINAGARVFTTPGGKKLVISVGRDKSGTQRWGWSIKKAGKGMIPRGTSALRRKLALGGAGRSHLAAYAARREKGRLLNPNGSLKGPRRTGVYKTAAELFETIEKARGLLPGGSTKLSRALNDRALRAYKRIASDGSGASHREILRSASASKYLGTRAWKRQRAGALDHYARNGVYKSLEQLDAVIEKAKGLINGGSRRLAQVAHRKAIANHESIAGRHARLAHYLGYDRSTGGKLPKSRADQVSERLGGLGYRSSASPRGVRTGKYK